ncbi:MAG TPA: hypothetical protein VJQ83_07905 [Tepidiformaceae bacterium]|nr:hypothetical protein [Tepidiformaceae bacterium]
MNNSDDDTMRDEYDFTKAVRGKHAAAFARRKGVVVLAPDVLEAFPDTDSVNNALRILIRAGKAAIEPTSGTR